MKETPPYRIGLDARFYHSSHAGLSRVTQEVIKRMATLDTTNQYYVFLTHKDKEEWTIDQPNFTPVFVDQGHYSYSEQTGFLRTLNSYQLDLVHFFNFNHPLLYRRPFIVTLYDMTYYFQPAGRSKKSLIRKQAFNMVFRHAMHKALRIISISHYSLQDVVKHLGVDKKKIDVIHLGPGEPLLIPKDSKTVAAKALGTDQPYFFFLSSWRPHKGIVTLIEAFNLLKAKGYPHKLVLGGRKDVSNTAVRDAYEGSPYKEDIIAPGFVDEAVLPALFHEAVASVCPSEYEGFGLPPLEAFSYKTAVIAANNSSLPEVVGDAGILFETKNAQALMEAMERLITDTHLRSELIAKGSEQLKKFSWDKTAEETLAVYHKVLKQLKNER